MAQASDVSWIFHPGYYTHSPVTGQRVAQYEPERASIVPTDPTYQESGYRHQVIQLGNENLNIVQTWGAGTAIRPYGEWERPFRPGATPYGPWGNPQGPWTLPFQSWQNPYGLNRMQYGSSASAYSLGPMGTGSMGAGSMGYGSTGPGSMGGFGAFQAGPQAVPAPAPPSYSDAAPVPPLPMPPRGQAL